MTLSQCGRADLMRALAQRDAETSAAMAALLGYHHVPRIDPLPTPATVEPTTEPPVNTEVPEEAIVDEAVDVPFWRFESYTAVTHETVPLETAAPLPRLRPSFRPAIKEPLALSHVLLARLRQVSKARRATREIDDEAVVEQLSRGEWLQELPTRSQRAWGTDLFIIKDRSRHLTPYWEDQDHVTRLLARLYPTQGLRVARYDRGALEPIVPWPGPLAPEETLPLSTRVLALTDLGCLVNEGQDTAYAFWLIWGRRLREQQILAIALVPTHTQSVAPELARLWTLMRWDASSSSVWSALSPQESSDAVEHLLALLSPAIRLEPGLVRAVRALLPEGRQDAGLEALLWQHQAIANPHSVAASWDVTQRRTYQLRFADQPQRDRQAVLDLIRSWHTGLHPAIWFEELLGLDPASQQELPDAAELRHAVHFLVDFSRTVWQSGDASADTKAWGAGILERLPEWTYRDEEVRDALHYLYDLVRPQAEDTRAPWWYDPVVLPAPLGQPIRQVHLWQVGDHIRFEMTDEPPSRESLMRLGSPLGRVQTASGEIVVTVRSQDSFWSSNTPPPWAHHWGHDVYGPWVTFQIGNVEQRMRWIEPGRFWMGSPEDEAGRDTDEGPRHEVELSHGYWLFDTPCTQALWETVMDENPSRFRGTQRPVENVSWDDCQVFLSRLNEQVPELDLRLPTEAQWEYACRSGTQEPRYEPDIDTIAWYSDNSSGETHDVSGKHPNAWGLYDMLGNVLEWCHDGRRQYTSGLAIDPEGSTEAGADRVLRGSVWLYDAQYARAAYRYWYGPGDRLGNVGFRGLSLGSEPVRAREGWHESERLAELAETRADLPAARSLHVKGHTGLSTVFPNADLMEIRTDCERLGFRRVIRPSWAKAIGRDVYGLWVRLEIGGVEQRLRWIGPGQFWMGSPEEEAEQYGEEVPRHKVELTQGFWLFDTPCTQALWEVVMDENPSEFPGANRPVERVSWEDCQVFINKLNDHFTDLGLGLPTEAQWEYACRAGTQGPRYHENLDAIAWYRDNSGGETHEVGQKRPSAWGLYDMLGNVSEWCEDWYGPYTAEALRNPRGPDTGADRVVRGGGWLDGTPCVRSAYRYWLVPGLHVDSIGFRCLSSGTSQVDDMRMERRQAEGGAHEDRDRGDVGGRSRLGKRALNAVARMLGLSGRPRGEEG